MVKSMRSRMRTKRRNKGKSKKLQYKRNKTIGRSKKGKKKRSRRVKKIIHRGGMFSGEYRGSTGKEESVNTGRLRPLYGGPRDVAGTTHDTPRADVKASDSSKDNLFAGRKPEKPEQTSYEMAGNPPGELTSWEEQAFGASKKGIGPQRSGVLSDPYLKASLNELPYARSEVEKKSRFNDINKCYPKNSWSYECGEHPDAEDKFYLSTGLSKLGIFTEPKNWSKYKYPVTDMENGKEYCCNEA